MKERTCCFTGHRHISAAELPALSDKLDKTIEQMIQRGVIFWGCGCARGFDMFAASAVLRQREKYPAVKLIIILPYLDHEERWPENDRQVYRRMLFAADKVVCLSDKYYSDCYRDRNAYLVAHSGVCIAYLKHARSGTSQTVRIARERGLTIINIAEDLCGDVAKPNIPQAEKEVGGAFSHPILK